MIVKLLTEHHLEFLSLKKAAEARPSLRLSKCQIVGNLTTRLKYDTHMYQPDVPISYFGAAKSKKVNDLQVQRLDIIRVHLFWERYQTIF